MDDREYEYLKRQIASLLDIDIDAYKSRQMRRRLTAFVQSRSGDSPAPFLRRLSEDAEALSDLREMLTINVSEFFRDAAQFETLERTVLPELLKKRPRLRIWSAGCSRGHEPYSVAILLEELGVAALSVIVASDLDRGALRIAKARGPYPESELRNVSRLRRSRHFSAVDGGHAVDRDLARRVQFKELNLLRDRFDRGFDLVICRNVMIYFSAEVKVALVRRFCDSLAPGGVLFIGATEALLGDEVDGFERMGGNFYRKVDAAAERPRASSRAA